MARWTKKLKAKQLAWTDACYRQSLLDLFGHRMSKEEKDFDTKDMRRLVGLDWNENLRTPEINAIYLKHICKLSSEKLSLILEAFQKGKQWRSQVTMDAIMTELFERSANPETRGNHES